MAQNAANWYLDHITSCYHGDLQVDRPDREKQDKKPRKKETHTCQCQNMVSDCNQIKIQHLYETMILRRGRRAERRRRKQQRGLGGRRDFRYGVRIYHYPNNAILNIYSLRSQSWGSTARPAPLMSLCCCLSLVSYQVHWCLTTFSTITFLEIRFCPTMKYVAVRLRLDPCSSLITVYHWPYDSRHGSQTGAKCAG